MRTSHGSLSAHPARTDRFRSSISAVCLGAMIASAVATGPARAADAAAHAEHHQRDFASPEVAVNTLVAAVRGDRLPELTRILGPSGQKLIRSGDPVADRQGRSRFVKAYDEAHRIERDAGGASATLILGKEQWPLPIPMVRQGARWRFDTEASAQKIIDRRVGRNELSVIEVCREFVAAQREYASQDRIGDRLLRYSAKFESTPGRRDGLYWEPGLGEAPSPLGPLFAQARTEGYPGVDPQDGKDGLQPYHGYYYRILTRQGAHAPGGARDNAAGDAARVGLVGGFAMLAYPARWGDSGIMTFMVNQDGIVFEKNLGLETERLAEEINEYDPDLSWGTP
jgi:hypothetical protein